MKNQIIKKSVIAGVVICASNAASAVQSTEELKPLVNDDALASSSEGFDHLSDAMTAPFVQKVDNGYIANKAGPKRPRNTQHNVPGSAWTDWFKDLFEEDKKRKS